MPTVMGDAVPIQKPAPELAVRANNVQQAIELQRQKTINAGHKRSKSKRQEQVAQLLAPTRPPKPHKVKVVGDPDRVTQLGDFIDVQTLDSSTEDLIEDDDSFDRERKILSVRSLHPLRKPSKKVDTSKYSWMPPEPATLPKPAKVTSQNDWHMSAEYPTVDDLFDKTDGHISEMGISEREGTAEGEDKPQGQRPEDQPEQAIPGAYDGDEEPEIIIDTYMNDDHTLWKATERVGDNTARSNQCEFRQERTERSSEEDEAVALMARLQALRK
jgi:hypothetical protein